MLVEPAKDIYDVLLPVYVLSKILGHAPFKLVKNRKRKFVPHCGVVVFARFVLVIGMMCYVSTVVEKSNDSGSIAGIALRCELYLGTIMTGVVLILGVTNQKALIDSVEKIIDIDKGLTSLGVSVTYRNAQKFAYAQIIFITCVFSSKIVIQFFSHSRSMLLMYSCFNIVDYINTIMLFQYVDILLLIRQRFIWLNRKIRGHAKKMCIGIRSSPNLLKTRSLTALLGYNALGRSQHQTNNDSELSVANLAKLYNKLCQVSRTVNRTYGVQLLVTICFRFIMITTQLINTYEVIVAPDEGDSVAYSLLTIYLALHSSKIFMVASISENTAAKARDTGIYLHDFWTVSREIQEQIEYFSLQVLHQDLKFTACGFFTLDYTLIYSIAGAVTTYFVIVIQFDKNRST